jgi:hypothetical protein
VDSGPNQAGAYGRVDGIIVTCKIVTKLSENIRARPAGTRTRINKQTNKQFTEDLL